MMQSAGILVYRWKKNRLEVLIAHNGGPYWANKDIGVWSLPKGNIENKEDPLEAAKREFKEETGFDAPEGDYVDLGEAKYPKSSKSVLAWAVEGEIDAANINSNTVEIEWPPRSGKRHAFPEIDRVEWHNLNDAAEKLFSPNWIFLERLAAKLGTSFDLPKEKQTELL